jgi:hypothetical protein
VNKATIGAKLNSNGAIGFQAGDVYVQEVAVYSTWLSDDRIQAHAAAAFRDATVLNGGDTAQNNMLLGVG